MILWRHHLNTCQRKIIVFLICLASSEQSEHLTRLSAVRKVLEILGFLELGIFETLGSKISHGASKKFADVRTHLRKVSKNLFFKRISYKKERKLFFIIQSSKKSTFPLDKSLP